MQSMDETQSTDKLHKRVSKAVNNRHGAPFGWLCPHTAP